MNRKMDIKLGFTWNDVKTWKNFVILLHQPRHASILAFTRIAFGLLMLIDIPQERGMTHADTKYGDDMSDICQFPFFSILKPLTADYMALLYTILVSCSFGIMFGCFYRISCFFFVLIYWYLFALDKSTWNNHSYLYGLLGFLFLLSDAHRYLSIDGLFRKKLRDSHVPLWNYTLLRFQIFLVYFYAGLKKTDQDWLMGYSMYRLTRHWVFDPMRYVMSDSMMDLVVVHYGGFLLDISAGFLLFFDETRILGFILCGTFHSLNSQIFNIGMFPYAMITTMFVFCPTDSFKKVVEKICCSIKSAPTHQNQACIYRKKDVRLNWKHYAAAFLTIFYISEQLFLPYSHFITKGYNGWTEGPYGYSWDMMVHNFKNQHVKIMYKDKHGKEGFLKPNAFLRSSRSRWSAHPDMTIQYVRCLKERLTDMGIDQPSIYVDVWKSMNGRFQQRSIDPSVDLANYDWSPFKKPKFVLPLLSELSDWRSKLQTISNELRNQTLSVVFIADFPGLSLENFIQEDFGNTTVGVLRGSVSVAVESKNANVTLYSDENVTLPAGEFHVVTTTSSTPSCYFYVYENTTEKSLIERVENYKKKLEAEAGKQQWPIQTSSDLDEDPMIVQLYHEQLNESNHTKRSSYSKFVAFMGGKYAIFQRRFDLNKQALESFATKTLRMFRSESSLNAPKEVLDKIINCYTIFLVSYFSIRNILFGKPKEEQLAQERFLMDYVWPETKLKSSIDVDQRSKTEL